MRGAVLVLVGLVLLVRSDDADASCGYAGVAWVVPPPIGAQAPLNVHPRVTLHATFRTEAFCLPWTECTSKAKGAYDLELRKAAGDVVAIEQRESISDSIATIELVPKQALEPSTRYEIRLISSSGATTPRILGTFLTGTTSDTTPPSWRGVTTFARFEGLTSTKHGGGVVTLSDPADACVGPGVSFRGPSAATDDQTRPEDIRYAFWIAEPDAAAIDYKKAPNAYAQRQLHVSGFEVAYGVKPIPLNDFAPPTKNKKTFKVGIRAVDLAGNMSSEPSEIVVR